MLRILSCFSPARRAVGRILKAVTLPTGPWPAYARVPSAFERIVQIIRVSPPQGDVERAV